MQSHFRTAPLFPGRVLASASTRSLFYFTESQNASGWKGTFQTIFSQPLCHKGTGEFVGGDRSSAEALPQLLGGAQWCGELSRDPPNPQGMPAPGTPGETQTWEQVPVTPRLPLSSSPSFPGEEPWFGSGGENPPALGVPRVGRGGSAHPGTPSPTRAPRAPHHHPQPPGARFGDKTPGCATREALDGLSQGRALRKSEESSI